MPVLAVTANILMSFLLFFGIVAALYGGTDVAATVKSSTTLRGGSATMLDSLS